MVRATVLVLLFLAVPVLAEKSKTTPAAQGGSTSKTLIALENRWGAALERSDLETLGSILADDYVDTDELGTRSDKRRALWALKSGNLKIESLKLSDMRVHNHGNAAIVTGLSFTRATWQGKPLPSKVVFTDTFVRLNGVWRAVASHRCVAP